MTANLAGPFAASLLFELTCELTNTIIFFLFVLRHPPARFTSTEIGNTRTQKKVKSRVAT